MSFDAQGLFNLLPAILRSRDLSQAVFTPGWLARGDHDDYIALRSLIDAGLPLTALQQQQYEQFQKTALAGPLASLLATFAEQIAALQEDLDQLYDDQFIETCADWVAPYIGDLIGYKTLHGVTPQIASPRAEVAHTIAYRRRKGTVVVLEQLARDVTGWNATAVEFFQRLVMTQYMNHLRPQCLATPDLRKWEPLQRLGSAFDSIMHTVDVRRIQSERGRYNIPNVGIFLWRIDAYPLSRVPVTALAAGDRRGRFQPLGIDQPLYTSPATIEDFSQLSTPLNVPEPISRRVLNAYLDEYYISASNSSPSLCIYDDSSGSLQAIDVSQVHVCNLEDANPTWSAPPNDVKYVVDPALGRIVCPSGLPAGTAVQVDFHYGFSGELGGGEYDRAASTTDAVPPPNLLRVPTVANPTIQSALDDLGVNGGVVVIGDSARNEETMSITLPAKTPLELRADNHCRPTLMLGGEFLLSGAAGAQITLDGLLIAGDLLRVQDSGGGNQLAALNINHCTLVPGWTLAPDCTPQHPDEPSLVVEISEVAVTIQRSILGSLHVDAESIVTATDSIIDATATNGVAYAAEDGNSAGGALQLMQCTVIGKINALKMVLVSNCILFATLASGDTWTAPVIAARRQEGCVRFSYVPSASRVPRRYRCLPESADSPELAVPRFTSLTYGYPAYAQLAVTSGATLLTGADNEGQPGAFNFIFQPQRETNLRVRLDEYLRTSLEAGIFYDS